MAKRKRLSLDAPEQKSASDTGMLSGTGPGFPAAPSSRAAGPLPPSPARAAPIAQIAGDASAQAALAALTQELESARASGRLVMQIPLAQIDVDYLARDRMTADPAEMADLIASILERGQQIPIEVAATGAGRYGLISGWRRLAALRHLQASTGEARFATVLALLRAPETAADAYRAMIEENEIRAGISYYERARIAALAAGAGVYSDARAAIAGLFAAASRAKRSKIGSFLKLYEMLDGQLRFGPAISERLGLALVRALEGDPDFTRRLRDRLRKAAPQTAEAETTLLEKALRSPADPLEAAPQTKAPTPSSAQAQETARTPHREEICPGIWLETEGGFSRASLRLSGARVDGPLRDRLVTWLKAQARGQ